MRLSGALLATVGVAVGGCSVAVADDTERAASTGDLITRGDVAVQRVVSLGSGSDRQAVTSRVSARFLQLSAGLDDAWVAMLIGEGRGLPAVGTCTERSSQPVERPPQELSGGSIELLDVGDVVIHAGPSTMPLAARAFPDVGDLVSGIVYTSRDESTELPAGVPYLLETTGSPLVRGFRLALDPPSELLDLTVNGEPLRGGEPVAVASEELELAWTKDDGVGYEALILAEIAAAGDPTATPLRCLFADSGEARVPAPQGLVDPMAESLDLSVHRLRRVVAVLPELEETAVEFDFVVTGRLPIVAAR